MKTYQDLLECGNDEKRRMEFVRSVVKDHKSTAEYRLAADAEEYYAKRNVTISKIPKLLYDTNGIPFQDTIGANYKLKTAFFRRFVIQQTQYVLSNGLTFGKDGTKKKLGPDFDYQIQKAAKIAMIDGASFLFWNLDHVEVFGFADTRNRPGFAAVRDQIYGYMRAGVRYWHTVDTSWYTFYEEDGYTEYIEEKGKDMAVRSPKRAYKVTVKGDKKDIADGTAEYVFENYPGFPIVPMFANDLCQSEFEGIRDSIDCYDFIKSGFANAIDDNSEFYWIIKNAGGMSDPDIMRFLDRLRTVRAAVLDEDNGVGAEAHTLEIPVEAREKMLDRLRNDLYEDFMLLDIEKALSGNMTATAIRLAYQAQDDKCGDFEYCIISAVQNLLKLIGIEDTPVSKWNRIANQMEETQMIMMAEPVIGSEMALEKMPFLTPEEINKAKEMQSAEELGKFDAGSTEPTETPTAEEAIDTAEELSGKTLNGSQTSSLITVIKGLKSGDITEGQAVRILTTAIGVTRDEALAIIRGDE